MKYLILALLLAGCQSRVEQAARFCPLICDKTPESIHTRVDGNCYLACIQLALSVTEAAP